ncbi:hypothetical protein B0H14DRAFT_3535080 [Mycena olivaceomarginata]|nr:hypothetical protein B0H14DRAFT_3535080 [Mycena olivaceomarginata]
MTLQRWNGTEFKRVTLKSMGLRVQLGHHIGEACPRPITGHKNFTVIHTNGIHDVAVDFCGCRDEIFVGSRRQQLLHWSWYPATHREPQTCSTLVALEMFHIMMLQGKVTTYDYYSGLEKLTDNTGLTKVRRSAPPELRGLYIMFIAIDACFRLKWCLVSSEAKDPGLGTGWSYFVEDAPFQKYLLLVTDQQEMSTCSGLAVLDYANTKFSRGYASTGVGLGVCARHEFVLANSAVDLQRGERYANMDYCAASLLRHICLLLFIVFLYDICCQWSKHLIERLKKLPANVRLTVMQALVWFVIPKLHIYGHKLLCQLMFSLNYLLHAARTDGEGIECPWANIDPLVGLGDLLKKRLLWAIPERNVQRDSLSTFTENQGEHVAGWKLMVEEFKKDQEKPLDARTKPNPYELPKSGLSENDVRLELAREEAAEQECGVLPINNVSPSTFILAGLDLEEQQVAAKVHKNDATSKQSAELIEKRTKLVRYVARFRKLQAVYMPGALQALADRPPGDEVGAALAENVLLFLPSALSDNLHATGCNKGVEEIELRFQDTQCRSALDQIRNHLYIKSQFRTYKGGQVWHQGATTRAWGLMDRNDEKIQMHSEKYVAAWEAMRVLVGEANLNWHRLDPNTDLRCMDSEEDRALGNLRKQRGRKCGRGEPVTEADVAEGVAEGQRRRDPTGKGRHRISWIWIGADTSASATNDAVLVGLRVEWAKAWARMCQWTEEVDLLREEMRRVPILLRHKAAWWMECHQPPGFEGEHAEGASAYATRQAGLYNNLAASFEALWAPVQRLEVVEDVRPVHPARDADSDDERDEDDGNDGINAEEEDLEVEDEQEGSTGQLSEQEEQDDY